MLRADPETAAIPVIAFPANALEDERRNAVMDAWATVHAYQRHTETKLTHHVGVSGPSVRMDVAAKMP